MTTARFRPSLLHRPNSAPRHWTLCRRWPSPLRQRGYCACLPCAAALPVRWADRMLVGNMTAINGGSKQCLGIAGPHRIFRGGKNPSRTSSMPMAPPGWAGRWTPSTSPSSFSSWRRSRRSSGVPLIDVTAIFSVTLIMRPGGATASGWLADRMGAGSLDRKQEDTGPESDAGYAAAVRHLQAEVFVQHVD
jgi:hypothetical protein